MTVQIFVSNAKFSHFSFQHIDNSLPFTTCTNPIIHLFYHPPPPPLCFRLLLGHFHVLGEIANNGYAKVFGGNRGVLWDCASSELLLQSISPTTVLLRNTLICIILVHWVLNMIPGPFKPFITNFTHFILLYRDCKHQAVKW